MFRTGAMAVNQDFTSRIAVTDAGGAMSDPLRLRWTIRNGQVMMARWERVPRDLSERRAGTVSHVAK